MKKRRSGRSVHTASAALTCCVALGVAGCAPGMFAGSASPASTPASAPGASGAASPGSSQPPLPASPGDGAYGAPAGGDPDSPDDDGGASRQPQQIPGKEPTVDPASVAGGPAVVREGGRLYLAVATPDGCAPLLGGTKRGADEWIVSLIEPPSKSCSSGEKVATYALPSGDEPETVVVEMGDQRRRVQVP